MKPFLGVCTALLAAVGSFGQAVHLKVTLLESKTQSRPNEERKFLGLPGSYSKVFEREDVLSVTVRNMAPITFDYTVEWMFFAAPVSGGKPEPFHAEEKKISLAKGEATTFEIRSPKVSYTHTHLSLPLRTDQNIFEGKKYAGYVVRVRIDDKVLAVESSDQSWKREFQNPKAKWGVSKDAAEDQPPVPKGKKKADR
ncbi:MAG: hypothetical protein N3B01_10680 [Verrucomicrobiae bacterium]|nr:hypothetical protein [Verrucomicrobiae bacterium]